MSKIATIAAAALLTGPLLLGPLLAASPASAQQQRQGEAGTSATPSATLPKRACRVTDRVGGRSCTADVPEAACAAIAREASGAYTWTDEECP